MSGCFLVSDVEADQWVGSACLIWHYKIPVSCHLMVLPEIKYC